MAFPKTLSAYYRLFAFALVGTLGFLVDAGVVLGLTGLGLGALAAQAVAVTVTWLGNRSWTFRDRAGRHTLPQEWARYCSANVVGWVVNNGVYGLLVLAVPFVAHGVEMLRNGGDFG